MPFFIEVLDPSFYVYIAMHALLLILALPVYPNGLVWMLMAMFEHDHLMQVVRITDKEQYETSFTAHEELRLETYMHRL
jgi:hypothetical protein